MRAGGGARGGRRAQVGGGDKGREVVHAGMKVGEGGGRGGQSRAVNFNFALFTEDTQLRT